MAQNQETVAADTIDDESLNVDQPSPRDVELVLLKLKDLEKRVDAYDPGIAEMSLEVGTTLASMGKKEEALSSFKRALHVSRVNYGLDSDLQLPALEAIFNLQSETNQFEAAADTLHRMQFVYQNNYEQEDPALLDLLIRIGLWHFSAYYFEIDNIGLSHLIEARKAFGRAHDSSLAGERDYNFDLYNLLAMTDHGLAIIGSQKEQSSSSDFNNTISNPATTGMITGSYRRGKMLLETGLEEASKSDDLENLIRATLLYGDWNQIFNKRHAARKLYMRAYNLAQNLPDNSRLRTSFNSPHRLPDFNSTVLNFGPRDTETQLVQVSFNVDDWGTSSKIDILPAKDGAKLSNTVKRAARNTVRTVPYRPAVVNGQPIDSVGVKQTVIVEL